MPGEPASGYRIICSQAVTIAFTDLVRRAFAQGLGDEVLAAARIIVRHLVNDPLTFGEPLYRLRGLQLSSRIGIESPLLVAYSVHEEKRLVFIKHFKPLPGHGL